MPLRRSERTASEARATRRPRSSLGDARLRICDVAFQPGNLGCEQRACRQRRVAIGLESRDGFGGVPGEILTAAIERRNCAGLEVSDAGNGGLQPAALLLVLRDRQRQRSFAALDGSGRIAHLLVENEEGRAVLQLLAGGGYAASEKCHDGLEHL